MTHFDKFREVGTQTIEFGTSQSCERRWPIPLQNQAFARKNTAVNLNVHNVSDLCIYNIFIIYIYVYSKSSFLFVDQSTCQFETTLSSKIIQPHSLLWSSKIFVKMHEFNIFQYQ